MRASLGPRVPDAAQCNMHAGSASLNSFGRLFAFFALGVIGSYCFMILPLVVAALSGDGLYTQQDAGFIGSAPLVGMFVGSVATAAVVHRIPWRATCTLAVLGLS